MEANNPEIGNNSRIVRSNWLLFSWSRISRANKAVLVMSLSLVMIQITATVVVLAIGNSSKIKTPSCEEPLELYLIIYVTRVGLTFPLIFYQHLSRTARQSNNAQPNLMSGWAYRFKSLLDLFAILWFIVGNYLVFSPSGCSSSASLYYYTILAWVVLGYALLLIPVVICISVIFCLPVVLVAMRAFNINVSTLAEGGTKEDLEKIPIFRYKSLKPIDEEAASVVASGSSDSGTNIKRKPSFTRKWMKDHQSTSKEEDSNIDNLTISKPEDAVCSICLSEYEDNDLLCKLWCDHLYHKDCVQEWLSLNTKCPLCKRDFRGKDFNQNTTEEEESGSY